MRRGRLRTRSQKACLCLVFIYDTCLLCHAASGYLAVCVFLEHAWRFFQITFAWQHLSCPSLFFFILSPCSASVLRKLQQDTARKTFQMQNERTKTPIKIFKAPSVTYFAIVFWKFEWYIFRLTHWLTVLMLSRFRAQLRLVQTGKCDNLCCVLVLSYSSLRGKPVTATILNILYTCFGHNICEHFFWFIIFLFYLNTDQCMCVRVLVRYVRQITCHVDKAVQYSVLGDTKRRIFWWGNPGDVLP